MDTKNAQLPLTGYGGSSKGILEVDKGKATVVDVIKGKVAAGTERRGDKAAMTDVRISKRADKEGYSKISSRGSVRDELK